MMAEATVECLDEGALADIAILVHGCVVINCAFLMNVLSPVNAHRQGWALVIET